MSVPEAEDRAAAAPLPESDSEEDTEDQSAREQQQEEAAQGRAEEKQPAAASAGRGGGSTEDRTPAENGGESPSRADVSGPVVAKAAATRLPDDSSGDEAESPKGASAESSLVRGDSDAHSEAAQGRGGALGGRRLDFSFAGDDASSDNSSSRTEATSAPRPNATAPPMVDTPSLPLPSPTPSAQAAQQRASMQPSALPKSWSSAAGSTAAQVVGAVAAGGLAASQPMSAAAPFSMSPLSSAPARGTLFATLGSVGIAPPSMPQMTFAAPASASTHEAARSGVAVCMLVHCCTVLCMHGCSCAYDAHWCHCCRLHQPCRGSQPCRQP